MGLSTELQAEMCQVSHTDISPEKYHEADRYLTYLAASGSTLNYKRFAMLIGIQTKVFRHAWNTELMKFLEWSITKDRSKARPLRCATIVLQAQKIPSSGFWENVQDQATERSKPEHRRLLQVLRNHPWQPSLSDQEIRKIEALVKAHQSRKRATPALQSV